MAAEQQGSKAASGGDPTECSTQKAKGRGMPKSVPPRPIGGGRTLEQARKFSAVTY